MADGPLSSSIIIDDNCVLEAVLDELKQQIADGNSLTPQACLEVFMKNNQVSNLVKQNFPGAIGSSIVLEKLKKLMNANGWTPQQILYAQSVCPDEINHQAGDITNMMCNYMGKVFHLGGLGGIPFSGKTGFGAYSHHVPESGHCFILLAPHIGLSNEGMFGKYSRYGQKAAGSACGAAVGAYKCICDGPPPLLDDDDLQFHYICQEMVYCKSAIDCQADENAKQVAIVQQMHKIAKTMLDKIVDTDFGGDESKLIILTGVQINMPKPFEDYFQPLSFSVHHKDGTVDDRLVDVFRSIDYT